MSWQQDDTPKFRKREAPTWQPAPPPYGEHPQQYQPAPPTNGLAIASLILSISSFMVLPLIGSIAGVVCGHMARSQLRQRPGEGDGLALAGLIIGWIGVAVYVGLIMLIVIGLGLMV